MQNGYIEPIPAGRCILTARRRVEDNPPYRDRLLLFILVTGLVLAGVRVGAAAEGGPEQIAANLGRMALTNSLAMEVATRLTTEIGPRLFGSEAERRAAAWAKQLFERLGFDQVWVESFPVAHGWSRGLARAEVTNPAPQPLTVTALGGSVATPEDGIEAEVALFHSYGDLLAAPVGSLAGKIAVVTQPMGRARNGSGYWGGSTIRTAGPSEAARRGAIAFLLRSLGTHNHRLTHTGILHYAPGIQPIPAAALSPPDALQLERLTANGGPVRLKLVLTPRDLGAVTSQNVVAELRGREQAQAIVLLGAHLDCWDLGTGAIDDGAGVAIVTAAAKLIRDLPQRPRRTIRVVLFGSEEPGLLGAQAYAQAHQRELTNYIVAAEADFGQGPVYRFRTGFANPQATSVQRIRAALAPFGVEAGGNDSGGSSDDTVLVAAHVPSAMFDMDGTDYFDFHHSADDTLDKIQPDRLNQSTAAYAIFAYLAAEVGGDWRAKR